MPDYKNKTKTELIKELESLRRYIDKSKKMQEITYISDAALKSIRECVYVVDEDFIITYFNEMCEKTFGVKASEVLGKSIVDLYESIEGYPGQNEERRKELNEKGYHRDEKKFRTRLGEFRMDVHTQAIIKDGKRAGWLILASDITERKKAEESLRLSDTTLRSIHEAVFAMDNNFRITYWNATCTKMFGIPEEEAIGKLIGQYWK